MKKITTPLFAVLCLFVLTGIAHATEAPEPALDAEVALDLFADQSTPEGDCDPAPAVAPDGQDPLFTTLICGTCSPSSSCVGKTRGSTCFIRGGFGTCDIYLGLLCSDNSGIDCKCYGPGGQIP